MKKIMKNYKREINTLRNEVSSLRKIIKDDLYKGFLNQLSEKEKINSLEQTNKRLRKNNKDLKERIKELEGNNGRTIRIRKNKSSIRKS